jgi:hypothetical protein
MHHIQSIGARPLARLFAAPCLLMASMAMAGVVDDSKASLELRNYYLNRDFRQESAR